MKFGSLVVLKMWLKLRLGILTLQLKPYMGNTCGCSEESLINGKNNEFDCSNICGLGAPRETESYIELTKVKAVDEYHIDPFALQSAAADYEKRSHRVSSFSRIQSLETLASRSILASESAASLVETGSPQQQVQRLSRQRE